ncbi:hypothetical protein ABPG77_002144 [Micractinium sp. CCAP 211/92]
MERGASAAEVRQAYRKALITAHPDKGGPRERFEQLQAAFAVLSDPVERLIYDENRLAAATDAIKALLQQLGTSQRGSPAAVSLGEAYASRAQLRKAAGQLHHALFDAEEALRLHPGLDIAAELRRELTAAIHVAEASDTGGRQTHSEGSRSSGSDDEPGGF